MENFDPARTTDTSMNGPLIIPIHYPLPPTYLTDSEATKSLLNSIFEMATTTSALKMETSGRQHLKPVEAYLNQQSCSLA